MYGLIEQAKQNPWGVSPESFVFWSTTRKRVPMQGQHFGRGLYEVLIQIGFSEQEAKKYSFHGWRHFFTSYMIKKLDKKLLKGETGHKTDAMINLYSNHETEGDREIIQTVKKETFAGLLPERANVIADRKKPLMIAAG
jgi:integrase